MKKISKALGGITILSLAFLGLFRPSVASAATLPNLGAAITYSVLAQTGITGTGTISGNVENNGTGAAITALTTAMVGGTIYSSDAVVTGGGSATTLLNAAVQADAAAEFNTGIPGQALTSNQGPVLDGLTLTTGVYDIGAGRLNGGILTLDGPGVYIFRASSDFISSGSINLINGARACDVFWRVQTLATINGSSFVGTILAGTGIHFGANVTLNGRALAIGGDVTLLTNTISGPTCAAVSVSSSQPATINVVKTVINDNGRTKLVSDFPLFVNGTPVVSGVTNTFALTYGIYSITETKDPNYAQSFSGDCDTNGQLNLSQGQNKFCIITNNDIGAPVVVPPVPPIIDVVKVPSPLSLPAGPGMVNYTYTLRNIGTVPVTDITMVGDTCSPITLTSGDTNGDKKLDLNEVWVHNCSVNLNATHTNTVVATGWANGISATDIASATVVVGLPIVPPIIHVTKVPNPLKLLAGGGIVTYTYKVTNPGTELLSNIIITDDKCSAMKYVSGDINHDYKLAEDETFTYTCQTKLTKTTTNTVSASGEANGMIARDLALATVVVAEAVPALPNTGIASEVRNTWQNVIMLAGALLLISAALVIARKKSLI
jgi:uncharacterized repeat protein (TIGR01451 family)